MVSHSSALAWKIPWTEEPGRLQSMGSLRVRLDRVTFSVSQLLVSEGFGFVTNPQIHMHSDYGLSIWGHVSLGEGNGIPLQCSCLENPMDRGAW